MFTLTNLTYLILNINAAIDTGKYNSISLPTVRDHIRRGDLFDYIKEQTKDDTDLSLLNAEILKEITDYFHDILLVMPGQEGRKFGIEKSGLCLIVAFTAELIQQRRWF